MSKLDCKYPGAVAWGKSYPAPKLDVRYAKNGSAPGYVRVSDHGGAGR